MIINSNEFSPSSSSASTGVCIVGAGAAGITLACELDRSGISVLLLEAGGYAPDADSAADYVGQAGKPHPETTEFRRVKLGGTTGIWGGRCVPYDPIDFERRDYWPTAAGRSLTKRWRGTIRARCNTATPAATSFRSAAH